MIKSFSNKETIISSEAKLYNIYFFTNSCCRTGLVYIKQENRISYSIYNIRDSES